jgi:hypothetical protein
MELESNYRVHNNLSLIPAMNSAYSLMFCFFKVTLIASCYPHLSLKGSIFPSDFQTKVLVVFLIYMRLLE